MTPQSLIEVRFLDQALWQQCHKQHREKKEDTMTIVIQKTKVRKKFSEHGVQLPESSINLINDHLDRQILKMVRRCKDGNVKRLTPNLFHIALGKYHLG